MRDGSLRDQSEVLPPRIEGNKECQIIFTVRGLAFKFKGKIFDCPEEGNSGL